MNENKILHGDPERFRERYPLPSDPLRSGPHPAPPTRIEVDTENLDRGLARLVLAVIELIRQLLERQALRRVEGGSLSQAEVERLGQALLSLEQRLGELRDDFGMRPSDLELRLGSNQDLFEALDHSPEPGSKS